MLIHANSKDRETNHTTEYIRGTALGTVVNKVNKLLENKISLFI